ncbi:MAG: Zn-ribbon domain-containing OB-fold protein [Chloroflexi bacterium]|nr:Zn-ribbon domain-containing OB-fold protein [Chloroflexota bacterium]
MVHPFTAASFNQFLGEHKLMASRCTQCKQTFLPPRAICPNCHSDQMEWVETSGKGTLAAFTSVYVGPTFMNAEGFDRNNPYATGIVELDEGVKISARLTGVDAKNPANIKIGTPMRVEFLDRGEGDAKQTFLAFTPAN